MPARRPSPKKRKKSRALVRAVPRSVVPRFLPMAKGELSLDRPREEWDAQITKLLGATTPTVARSLMVQVADAIPGDRNWKDDPKKFETYVERMSASVDAVTGIGPRDQVEGLLAVQMVSAHDLTMEFLKRAAVHGQHPENVNDNVTRATKLMRAYAMQLDALQRYRGKGQQHVTVEHVHVEAGAQAVVGTVNTDGRKGGGGHGES